MLKATARERIVDGAAEELVVFYEKDAHNEFCETSVSMKLNARRQPDFSRTLTRSASISLRRPSSAIARPGRGGAASALVNAARAPA